MRKEHGWNFDELKDQRKNDIFMRKKNDLAKLKADEHQNNSRFKSQINRQNKSS